MPRRTAALAIIDAEPRLRVCFDSSARTACVAPVRRTARMRRRARHEPDDAVRRDDPGRRQRAPNGARTEPRHRGPVRASAAPEAVDGPGVPTPRLPVALPISARPAPVDGTRAPNPRLWLAHRFPFAPELVEGLVGAAQHAAARSFNGAFRPSTPPVVCARAGSRVPSGKRSRPPAGARFRTCARACATSSKSFPGVCGRA